MRSTSGVYYAKLDHVRALAAFLVFTWHFTHVHIPVSYVPHFPVFSVFEEGHGGVSLFMTLSGYIFARILTGKDIIYHRFIRNRALRLLPLLFVVIAIVIIQHVLAHESIRQPLHNIIDGLIFPTLPNGGWSITVEAHFYLLLPFIISLAARNPRYLLLLLIAAIGLRTLLFFHYGEVQSLAYWTIIGRFDQFVLGMFFALNGAYLANKKILGLLLVACWIAAYHIFARLGGFYYQPSYPSTYPTWIVWPTIEGLVFGSLIAFYDRSSFSLPSLLSRGLGIIGECSFSIYLLQLFYVVPAALFIRTHGVHLAGGSFLLNFLAGAVAFLLFVPVAWLSYSLIEKPFLKLRVKYSAAQKTT